MRAMYWQGLGSAKTLAYGNVTVGMQFVAGPQWPAQVSNPSPFALGTTYTITNTFHQSDNPVIGGTLGNAPTPWNSAGGAPNTTESVDYVTFNASLVASDGVTPLSGSNNIGDWFPTTYLANAYHVGG